MARARSRKRHQTERTRVERLGEELAFAERTRVSFCHLPVSSRVRSRAQLSDGRFESLQVCAPRGIGVTRRRERRARIVQDDAPAGHVVVVDGGDVRAAARRLVFVVAEAPLARAGEPVRQTQPLSPRSSRCGPDHRPVRHAELLVCAAPPRDSSRRAHDRLGEISATVRYLSDGAVGTRERRFKTFFVFARRRKNELDVRVRIARVVQPRRLRKRRECHRLGFLAQNEPRVEVRLEVSDGLL